MSKTNYINYQEILKDGSYYEINSYGKRKRQIKKFFKLIWCNIIRSLRFILAIMFVVLIPILVITFIVGLGMLVINVSVGLLIVGSSLIVGLLVEPIIAFIWEKLDDYCITLNHNRKSF